MPLAFLNRCAFVPSAYSDTDDFALNGSAPVTGFYAPASCTKPSVVDGATYRYFAESADKTQHEEGDGVWDVGTSTLTRAIIRNSSNSGAKVNFSAAPTVSMGGPCANDMSGEELLGYVDLEVSGPSIIITLDADLRQFQSITLRALNPRIETSSLDLGDVDDFAGIQVVLYDGDGTPLATVATLQAGSAYPVSGALTELVGIERETVLWTSGAYVVAGDYWCDVVTSGTPSDSAIIIGSNVGSPFDGPVVTPVTLKLKAFFYDNSAGDYGTPPNMTSGKIWFYGRRK